MNKKMTKIEELIQEHIDPHVFKGIAGYYALEDAMKEYAEYYAKKCLEISIENAIYRTDGYGNTSTKFIDKDSILNIILPEHE